MKKLFNNPIVQVILLIVISFLAIFIGQIIGDPIYLIASMTGNEAMS